MKVRTLFIGTFVILLLFTFLPTSIDEDVVMSNFIAIGNVQRSQASVIAPYIMDGTLTAENDEGIKSMSTLTSIGGWTGQLYEVVNSDGTSTYKKPDKMTSHFANTAHISGSTHGGTDMVCNDVSSKVVWTVALLPGVVQKVGRDTSYGHYVVQTVDGVPGMYILYAHMGNGNAWGTRVSSGTMPRWQSGNESSIQVSVGDVLSPGTRLGYLGTTGDSSGPHSHVELRYYKDADGKPEVFNIGTYPRSACFRSNVWDVLSEGKQFSELIWMWYEKGNVYPDKKLTSEDMLYFASIETGEGDVGDIEEVDS